MSGLQFFAYADHGQVLRSQLWYSQSVRVGDRIEISGQGITSPFPLFYPFAFLLLPFYPSNNPNLTH
jgi:hypothetical protein